MSVLCSIDVRAQAVLNYRKITAPTQPHDIFKGVALSEEQADLAMAKVEARLSFVLKA